MNEKLFKHSFFKTLFLPSENYDHYTFTFRIFLCLFSVIFIFPALTGIIRYYSSMPLKATAPIAVCITAFIFSFESLCMFITYKSHDFSKRLSLKRSAGIWFGFIFLAGYFLFAHMWNPYFHGLPMRCFLGGGDSGVHVEIANRFYTTTPQDYSGQNAFYALIYWFGAKPGLGFFRSFRTVTYILWIMMLAAPVCIWLSLVAKKVNSFFSLPYLLLALLITCFFYNHSEFPWFSYLQLDGFYSALSGYAALILGIIFVACAPNLAGKIFWFLLFTLLIRHSYVLNIGEFLLAGTILFAREIPRKSKLLRLGLGALAIGSAGVAVAAYISFIPLLKLTGGFDEWSLWRGLPFETLLLALIFLTQKFIPKDTSASLKTYLDFCLYFIGVGLVIQIVYLITGLPPYYYFFKHGYGIFLVAGSAFLTCTIAALFTWLSYFELRTHKQKSEAGELISASIFLDKDWRTSPKAISIFLLTAFFMFKLANDVYIKYHKRTAIISDWETEHLVPLVDAGSVKIMDDVLKEKKAELGGYLHSSPALWKFTIASFGKFSGEDLHYFGVPKQAPGTCVFWAEAKYVLEQLESQAKENPMGQGKLAYYKSALSDSHKTCKEPEALTPPEFREQLCWRCY